MQHSLIMATDLDLSRTATYQYIQGMRRKPENFTVNPQASGFEQVLLQLINDRPAGFNTAASPVNVAEVRPPDEETRFRKCLDFVLKKEGNRLVKEDTGKGASRYGILQSTARAFGYRGNIKNITMDQVEAIYRKIWDRSGAGSLPYPLCIVHFDTYVNSPAAAQKILQRSGGDIDSYLDMREKRYIRLATGKPQVYAKYLKGWRNRVDSLRTVVAQHQKDTMYAYKGIPGLKDG